MYKGSVSTDIYNFFKLLLFFICDIFSTASPATGFYGFRYSALRATCPAVPLTLTTISLRWSCLVLAECFHARIIFLQQTTYGNFVQLCMKTDCTARVVRTYARGADGPHRPYATLLRPYCACVITTEYFFFLDLRSVTSHTEIQLWPARISSSWPYARCPLPMAAHYST